MIWRRKHARTLTHSLIHTHTHKRTNREKEKERRERMMINPMLNWFFKMKPLVTHIRWKRRWHCQCCETAQWCHQWGYGGARGGNTMLIPCYHPTITMLTSYLNGYFSSFKEFPYETILNTLSTLYRVEEALHLYWLSGTII